MGRGRARQALLTVTAAALAAATAPPLPLRDARWIADDADAVEALSSEPAECLTPAAGPDERMSVAIGRAAFRTPLLLGGQAARAGLSCSACHINGHGNPHFSFPGITGAPGTADVTTSILSKLRGDATFNPKPIPSLYDPPRLAGHDPASRALETFIRGLIVEEFDGPPPREAVLHGLANYVRALRGPCGGRRAVTFAGRIDDVRRAVRSADAALGLGDSATARLMILAARDGLGQVAERFRGPGFNDEVAKIRAADLDLAAILPLLDADRRQARERLAAFGGLVSARLSGVARHEGESLFNRQRLANWPDGR